MKKLRLPAKVVARVTWVFPLVSLGLGGTIVAQQYWREASLRTELAALKVEASKFKSTQYELAKPAAREEGHENCEGHDH